MAEITTTIVGASLADYIVDVALPEASALGTVPTTFTRLGGVQELTPFAVEKNLEDDSEINGEAWGSQIATGLSWTAETKVKNNAATTTVDPGLAILQEASEGIGVDGLVWLRITRRGETTARAGLADVSLTADGGKRTDLDTYTAAFSGRGAIADVTVTPTGATG